MYVLMSFTFCSCAGCAPFISFLFLFLFLFLAFTTTIHISFHSRPVSATALGGRGAGRGSASTAAWMFSRILRRDEALSTCCAMFIL